MAGSSQAPQFEDDYGPESPYANGEAPRARAPAVQTTSSLVSEDPLASQEVSHTLNGSAAPPQAAAPAGQTTLMGEGGCDAMEIQPDAAAGGIETTVINPQQFRVGPEKHAFNYTRQDGLVYGRFPVYACSRGRDTLRPRLYLYHSWQAGLWCAVSVESRVPTLQDIVLSGIPAFRSADAGVDVRAEGRHRWQCYDNVTNTWWGATPFTNTHLRV